MLLNNIAQEQLTDFVLKFVESGQTTLEAPSLPLNNYSETFKQLGFTLSDIETYGWEASFCYEVENPQGVYLSLKGSLYYGNFIIENYTDAKEYRHFMSLSNGV